MLPPDRLDLDQLDLVERLRVVSTSGFVPPRGSIGARLVELAVVREGLCRARALERLRELVARELERSLWIVDAVVAAPSALDDADRRWLLAAWWHLTAKAAGPC